MAPVIFGTRIRLFDKRTLRVPMPNTRPCLVGPAKTERKLRLPRCDHFNERSFKQSLSPKPVVIITKPLDARVASQFSLGFPDFRYPQVIITKVCGKARLIMPLKEGSRFRYVSPLRKSLAPPGVILRDRVKLRKVESN